MATEKKQVSIDDFLEGMFDLDGAFEHNNIMIYGPPGCGKTSLVGTLPPPVEGKKHLILAGEPGFRTAARRGLQAKVRHVPDTAMMSAAVSWLEYEGADKIDYCVVEGVTTMQNKWLLAYAAEAWDQNNAKRTHRNLPDKPDYQNAQNAMKGYTSRLIDLPCHVIFTAHAMYPEDSDGDPMICPNIQGKGHEVSDYIVGQMMSVGYMSKIRKKVASPEDPDGPRVSKEVRRITWQQTQHPETKVTVIAKDQTDTLGRYTDDKTLAELIEMMKANNPSPEAEEKPAMAPGKKAKKNVNAKLRR